MNLENQICKNYTDLENLPTYSHTSPECSKPGDTNPFSSRTGAYQPAAETYSEIPSTDFRKKTIERKIRPKESNQSILADLIKKVTYLTRTVNELKELCRGFESRLQTQIRTNENFYSQNEKALISRQQKKEIELGNKPEATNGNNDINRGKQDTSSANKIAEALKKREKEKEDTKEINSKKKIIKIEPVVKRLQISVEQAHQIISGVNPFTTTKYKILKLKDVPEMKIANLKQAVALTLKLSVRDIAGVYFNREKKYWTLFINQTRMAELYSAGIDECMLRNKNIEFFKAEEVNNDKEYFENLTKNLLENPNIHNKAFLIAIKILKRGISSNNIDDLNSIAFWEENPGDLSLVEIDTARSGDNPAGHFV
jgi:hypothetical protein